MKRTTTRLKLNRETVLNLSQLDEVRGGDGIPPSATAIYQFCTSSRNCPKPP